MKTICFSSIKGGTGKSSLCILTANYAASAGYRVLVADLDHPEQRHILLPRFSR